MNKTVTINISGIIFHIEEDAYEGLSKYLSTIKSYFSNTDGGNEILGDIEARIAELLQGKINTSKQVVLMTDVDYVKSVMGRPEDFGTESPNDGQKTSEEIPFSEEKIKRRLFRDPDERAIGGVCSGLANYFDIDTVWVRLAMFFLVFFGGISLWVYIVLWIIIPLAKTTVDKFAMRGESANVNNIIKSFKEEAEDVKSRFNKYGKEIKNNDYANSIRNNATGALRIFFNILGRFLGLFVFFIGAAFLLAFVAVLFGFSFLHTDNDLGKWKAVIVETSSDYALAVTAFIIVCGIPIFMLILTGIKLLFRIRYNNRWLNMSLGIVWALGIILASYAAIGAFKQFNDSTRLKETAELHGLGDTIVVKLNPYLNTLKTLNIDNEDDKETFLGGHHERYYFGKEGERTSVFGFVNVNIIESSSDSVELTVIRGSRGGSKKEANENAKAINYAYHQEGREIILDEIFSTAPDCKFRKQEVTIIIKLPQKKVIFLDKSLKSALDNVNNTTNTWDGDMINRRWKMTEKGLACVDCKDLDNIGSTRNNSNEEDINISSDKMTINGKEISVKDGKTEIKIYRDGFRNRTPESKESSNSNEDKTLNDPKDSQGE